MKITCDPNNILSQAEFCSNWTQFKFFVDGKEYPAYRVRLADDVAGTLDVFLVNEMDQYLFEGQGSPPAFESLKGIVKIVGLPCSRISKCDLAYFRKKTWWTSLRA